MNDHFQDARVLAQDKDSCTVEVTYYPFCRPAISENPNWRKDYAKMTLYLKPTPTENWDEAMQRDLLTELRQAGIDPDHLTDKQLVEQVSRWAMRRTHSTDAFGIWAVYYPDGKPAVYPPLREAFDRQKPDKTWTDQQMFDHEALGRSMFYNKVHGSCTSSSVYLATIFRALGIPARIVFCIPPFDPNDDAQARMFYDNVHYNQVRETVRAALDGTGGFEGSGRPLFWTLDAHLHLLRPEPGAAGADLGDALLQVSGRPAETLLGESVSSDLRARPLWRQRTLGQPAGSAGGIADGDDHRALPSGFSIGYEVGHGGHVEENRHGFSYRVSGMDSRWGLPPDARIRETG
jgi:hypothetical protein